MLIKTVITDLQSLKYVSRSKKARTYVQKSNEKKERKKLVLACRYNEHIVKMRKNTFP